MHNQSKREYLKPEITELTSSSGTKSAKGTDTNEGNQGGMAKAGGNVS